MGFTDWLRLLAWGRFQMAPWHWLELPLSTLHLWERLDSAYGLQIQKPAGLQDRVLDEGAHLYRAIEMGRETLGEGRFHEICYEDLIRESLPERMGSTLIRISLRKSMLDFALSATAMAAGEVEAECL